MTDLVVPAPTELVNVLSGEVLGVRDVPGLAGYLADLREHKAKVLDEIKAVEHYLLAESETQGTKTLHAGARQVKVYGGPAVEWDVTVLVELLGAGLPQERYDELVKVTLDYKVSAAVAKQLEAANPRYADIIGRARRRVEKPFRVSVSA